MGKRMIFVLGMALGAGVMYLLDPDRGRRRRALIRDQFVSAGNTVDESFTGLRKDVSNRAQGIVAEARGQLSREPVTDRVLSERVRSELGRVSSHPGSIEVAADQGRVILSGPILKDEVNRVVSAASSVNGVLEVENRLEIHEETGNVPGLQS